MSTNQPIAFRSAWLGAVAGLALLAGCTKPGEPVLARVGDREFRAADVKAEVDYRVKIRRPVPDKETLLREMMTQEALLQRARKAGLDQDFVTRRELNNLLISKLWEQEAAARASAITVTDAEVKAEYERNLARYTQAPKVRLALLQVNGERLMSDAKRTELRARMEDARRKALEQPASVAQGAAVGGFGALAVDYSEDVASRFRGGDIGWLEQGNPGYHWPATVLQAGYALPRGKISEVLEAGASFYVVMKTDERPATVTPLAQVESNLRQSLLQKKRLGLETAFREESLRQSSPVVDAKALAAYELPAAKEQVVATNKSEPPGLPGGRSLAP